MKIYQSDVHFSIYDYKVSHHQLLLRGECEKHNIDIIFFGVFSICIEPSYKNIKIRIANFEDIENMAIDSSSSKYRSEKFYIIESQDKTGYIGALELGIYENNLNFDESSLGVISFKGRDNLIFQM